jgi:Uncharacterised nucleotidyltransferase
MPRTPEPVLGALQLRAWALAGLASSAPPPSPPAVSGGAWGVFLRTERCALALSSRAAPAEGTASEALRAQALAESRAVLAARGLLHRAAGIARARGLRLVVLKGGMPLVEGSGGMWLMDVDVLATPADAAVLAGALDEAGYRPHGPAAAHRLPAQASARDHLIVEIHTAVPGADRDVWQGVRPAAEGAELLVLHPADHLRHLLLHSVVHHAGRRGRIRDLLLVAHALQRCSADEVEGVRRALEREAEARALAAQLAMARALAAADGRVADAFELTAAGNYLMDLRFGRWRSEQLRELARIAGTVAVARRSGMPTGLGSLTLGLPSAFAPFAWMRRVAPAAERGARLLARRGREWMLLPVGLQVASAAERALRERGSAG